jgi:hypothetical protein
MGKRWEYRVEHEDVTGWPGAGPPADLADRFTHLGADGWELVGTDTIEQATAFGGSKTTTLVAYFKRRVKA